MIEETCREIGELRDRWIIERHARYARRDKIRLIDDLINQFELLNLADEPVVPAELSGRVSSLVRAEAHPICQRPPSEVAIIDWMDALYDVQDTLMIEVEDDIE